MGSSPPHPEFLRELRRVLHHLYDPSVLRRSPLPALFGLSRSEGLSALQQIMTEAIQALKPRRSTSRQSGAWRNYRTLSDRFIDQFTQREVAVALGLSLRQMKRQEGLALGALADFLWAHHGLQTRWLSRDPASPSADEGPSSPGSQASSQEQELQWLERSSPSEAVEVGSVLETLLNVVTPLATALGVAIDCSVSPHLPPLTVQLTPVRQAILNVLTVSIHAARAGRVDVRAEAAQGKIRIRVQSVAGQASSCPLPKEQADNLDIARELARLSGGSLRVRAKEADPAPFSASLVLPAAARAPVLVVDDNVDTLQLFQRYLAGSRYPFVGIRDPDQALAMAADLGPQIIVLDVMLPGMDGWELLGRLRTHPRTQHIPIVVCTILSQEQLALSLGAAAFIRKPVTREALLAALDRQLGRPSPESR